MGVVSIPDGHRPDWCSSAAGLQSRFLGLRSPSTAKLLPGLDAVPQPVHHNQTAQAASEGCVCLLQEGTEAPAKAVNASNLYKQLYCSDSRM